MQIYTKCKNNNYYFEIIQLNLLWYYTSAGLVYDT